MCDKCGDLDAQLTKYRRFLSYTLDALTIARLEAGLQTLEQAKKALHPETPISL